MRCGFASLWERTRLACWLESLAVASHPLQRRRAETIFIKCIPGSSRTPGKVRDREDAFAPQTAVRPTRFVPY